MIINRHNQHRGFTLVETLVYIVGMVALISAIIGFLTAIYSWYSTSTVVPRTDRAGLAIADQLVRAIWTGQTINASSTIFNVTNGTLGLDSVMSTTTGTTTLRYFYLSGGRIVEQDNGGTVQYISPADLSVTKLYFTQLTSSAPSVAVRFQIDIAYTIKSITQKKTYTGFAILKNSYK